MGPMASAAILSKWSILDMVRPVDIPVASFLGLVLAVLLVKLSNSSHVCAIIGIMGGLGLGIVYTPVIQSLIQWFPDKKG